MPLLRFEIDIDTDTGDATLRGPLGHAQRRVVRSDGVTCLWELATAAGSLAGAALECGCSRASFHNWVYRVKKPRGPSLDKLYAALWLRQIDPSTLTEWMRE